MVCVRTFVTLHHTAAHHFFCLRLAGGSPIPMYGSVLFISNLNGMWKE
jgi:hypothetical protein